MTWSEPAFDQITRRRALEVARRERDRAEGQALDGLLHQAIGVGGHGETGEGLRQQAELSQGL